MSNLKLLKTLHDSFGLSLIWLLSFMLSVSTLEARDFQQFIVKGKVTSAGDGLPLTGVSIVDSENLANGVVSDVDGNYQINLSSTKSGLKVSYLGFKTQVIAVNGKSSFDIVLKEDLAKLDEVVVVGYGTQKKSNLTGSVASVNMEDIKGVPISNVATALQGRLPGVTISSFNNQPGKNDPQIRIRGIGTLGSNSPLVVIDGVPSEVNALGDLSPDDIESISVLKDASSASIYGVRAANGVILVTSRRGKTGKPQVQFRETFSLQKPLIKPSYMDALTWANAYNDFLNETGAAPAYTADQLQKIQDQSDPDNFANTDWFDEVYKTAPMQNHYLSASGGSDFTKYLVAVEYQKQDGVIDNTGSNRIQLRANLDNKISDAVSFGLNLRGYKQKINEPIAAADGNDDGDNGINRVISGFTRPTVAARYSFGQYGSTDGTILGGIKNPLRSLYEQVFDTDDYRLDGKVFGELKFLKNFSFTSSLAIVYQNTKIVRFNPSLPTYGPTNNLVNAGGLNSLFNSSENFTRYVNENLLRYNKIFGKHDFKVLVGHTLQRDQNELFSASVVNLPSNSIRVIGASTQQPTNGGNANALSLQSFLGRINYIYDNKYLFEASARIDGSSRLPQSQQYPLFPSVSAGWIISEEPFLKNNNLISLLKLRGSYGVLGNQDIGNYAYSQNYNLSQNYVYNGAVVQGVAITNLANSDIKWETTRIADVGLDLEMFKGKLALVAGYFYKSTSDILFNLPIPNTLGGLGAPPQNSAKVNNRGFELDINHRNKIGEFSYNVGLNGSVIKNKVVSLAGETQVITGNSILIPGSPINSQFGYIADGIIRTQQELDSAPKGVGSIPLRLGDIKYRDLTGDGAITPDDRVIIGNPFPKLSYGFTLGGSYKNFDLSVFFQGVAGVDRYFQDPAAMNFRQQKLNVWNDRFKLDNTDGVLPRYGNAANNNAYSSYGSLGSYGLLDGSYLRLKNLEVGYNLPLKIISRIGMSRVRLYFSGVNLYTFTKVKNYDVEKAEGDDRSLGYLNTKNYAFGLNIAL